MKYTSETTSIFTRYDLNQEVERRDAIRISDDEMLQRVADCLITGNDRSMADVIDQAVIDRHPMEVINRGLLPGMREVGRLWEEGSYFLPQVILSSDTMLIGIKRCEARMGRAMLKKAKVVTHTAEGDIHDIGQVIVNALINAAGFEVIDLGADVPVEEVVDACRIHQPVMLTGTALMTTTMTAFPKIARRLERLGLKIPFVCGGGAVNEAFVNGFDLGIWGKEAGQAVGMAEDALAGMNWRALRSKWNG